MFRGQRDYVRGYCGLQVGAHIQDQTVDVPDMKSSRSSFAQNLNNVGGFEEANGRGKLTL